MDIFAAAGLAKPDLSILSDEFLAEVRGMPHRNLAVELLQKLPQGELRVRRRKNLVQARSFAEMLEATIRRYQNRAVEAAQVIEELIQLARRCSSRRRCCPRSGRWRPEAPAAGVAGPAGRCVTLPPPAPPPRVDLPHPNARRDARGRALS